MDERLKFIAKLLDGEKMAGLCRGVLTDGQGRALSAHRTQQAYIGYAKRTLARALCATRKRYAHRLVNAQGTNIENTPLPEVQNAIGDHEAAIA